VDNEKVRKKLKGSVPLNKPCTPEGATPQRPVTQDAVTGISSVFRWHKGSRHTKNELEEEFSFY